MNGVYIKHDMAFHAAQPRGLSLILGSLGDIYRTLSMSGTRLSHADLVLLAEYKRKRTTRIFFMEARSHRNTTVLGLEEDFPLRQDFSLATVAP